MKKEEGDNQEEQSPSPQAVSGEQADKKEEYQQEEVILADDDIEIDIEKSQNSDQNLKNLALGKASASESTSKSRHDTNMGFEE